MSLKPAIISVHDVMPHTLDRVEQLLVNELQQFDPQCVLLLIVPGLDWSPGQMMRLRAFEAQGYELAGHGWVHCTRQINSVYHRLHSLFLSRTAAEHLSYNENELVQLLNNNYRWFKNHDFKLPKFYVPPAWAMGRICRSSLQCLPFCGYETTSRIIDVRSNQSKRMPLVGFEADTKLRAIFLQCWNRLNFCWSSPLRPLRISIHPYDTDYLIADQLQLMLTQVYAVHWRSLFLPEVTNKKQKEDASSSG